MLYMEQIKKLIFGKNKYKHKQMDNINCADYITGKSTIIFSPGFNKCLDPQIICLYKKIIFINLELDVEFIGIYDKLTDECTPSFCVDLHLSQYNQRWVIRCGNQNPWYV